MKLLMLISLLLVGCPHPPVPPDPPTPGARDTAVIDGPPADCSKFSGKYSVTDNPSTPSDPACTAKVMTSVLHINPDDMMDVDSQQWGVTIFDEDGHKWIGLAKQLESNPSICRFVVEIFGDPPATGTTVVNRDFTLGEQPRKGIGESVVRDGKDCIWQSVMVLTALQ